MIAVHHRIKLGILLIVITFCNIVPYLLLHKNDESVINWRETQGVYDVKMVATPSLHKPVKPTVQINNAEQLNDGLYKKTISQAITILREKTQRDVQNDDEWIHAPWQEPTVPCEKECEVMLGARYHSSARQQAETSYCQPTPDLPFSLSNYQSDIRCGILWDTAELGSSGTYCRGENLYVDFNSLVEQKATPDCRPEWPPANPEETARWWQIPVGSISAVGCSLQFQPIDGLLSCIMPKITNHTSVSFDQYQSTVSPNTYEHQLIHNEPITTLITIRDEYANIYHQHAEYFNALFTLHQLNISSSECQVLLLDEHPSVPLDEFWNVVCSHGIKRVADYQTSRPSVTKLEKVAVIPTAYSNVLNWVTVHADCLSKCESKMITKWRRSVLDYFQAPVHQYNATSIHITFLARRAKERNFKNMSGMEDVLNEFVQSGYQIGNTELQFTFATHYFEDLSLKEQIAIISQTDVLLTMHGAGCTHVLYLPETSVLAEITRSTTDMHFARLASWSGHEYVACLVGSSLEDFRTCIKNVCEKWQEKQNTPKPFNKLIV